MATEDAIQLIVAFSQPQCVKLILTAMLLLYERTKNVMVKCKLHQSQKHL